MVLRRLRLGATLLAGAASVGVAGRFDFDNAPAPLWRDPRFDGATDPSVVYDEGNGAWVMYYTQRKASDLSLGNKSWCLGTEIGIAASFDGGRKWKYQVGGSQPSRARISGLLTSHKTTATQHAEQSS